MKDELATMVANIKLSWPPELQTQKQQQAGRELQGAREKERDQQQTGRELQAPWRNFRLKANNSTPPLSLNSMLCIVGKILVLILFFWLKRPSTPPMVTARHSGGPPFRVWPPSECNELWRGVLGQSPRLGFSMLGLGLGLALYSFLL